MLNKTIKTTRKAAAKIIEATFPDYNGKKITVEFTDKVTFCDMNWSGGTKNAYKVLSVDGSVFSIPAPAPWVNVLEGKSVDMTRQVLVVQHSYFCGKDCGIRIYAHPSYMSEMLPAKVS
jgi:hypothetical protein